MPTIIASNEDSPSNTKADNVVSEKEGSNKEVKDSGSAVKSAFLTEVSDDDEEGSADKIKDNVSVKQLIESVTSNKDTPMFEERITLPNSARGDSSASSNFFISLGADAKKEEESLDEDDSDVEEVSTEHSEISIDADKNSDEREAEEAFSKDSFIPELQHDSREIKNASPIKDDKIQQALSSEKSPKNESYLELKKDATKTESHSSSPSLKKDILSTDSNKIEDIKTENPIFSRVSEELHKSIKGKEPSLKGESNSSDGIKENIKSLDESNHSHKKDEKKMPLPSHDVEKDNAPTFNQDHEPSKKDHVTSEQSNSISKKENKDTLSKEAIEELSESSKKEKALSSPKDHISIGENKDKILKHLAEEKKEENNFTLKPSVEIKVEEHDVAVEHTPTGEKDGSDDEPEDNNIFDKEVRIKTNLGGNVFPENTPFGKTTPNSAPLKEDLKIGTNHQESEPGNTPSQEKTSKTIEKDDTPLIKNVHEGDSSQKNKRRDSSSEGAAPAMKTPLKQDDLKNIMSDKAEHKTDSMEKSSPESMEKKESPSSFDKNGNNIVNVKSEGTKPNKNDTSLKKESVSKKENKDPEHEVLRSQDSTDQKVVGSESDSKNIYETPKSQEKVKPSDPLKEASGKEGKEGPKTTKTEKKYEPNIVPEEEVHEPHYTEEVVITKEDLLQSLPQDDEIFEEECVEVVTYTHLTSTPPSVPVNEDNISVAESQTVSAEKEAREFFDKQKEAEIDKDLEKDSPDSSYPVSRDEIVYFGFAFLVLFIGFSMYFK